MVTSDTPNAWLRSATERAAIALDAVVDIVSSFLS